MMTRYAVLGKPNTNGSCPELEARTYNCSNSEDNERNVHLLSRTTNGHVSNLAYETGTAAGKGQRSSAKLRFSHQTLATARAKQDQLFELRRGWVKFDGQAFERYT
jgi:hypothetical protein